MPQQASVSLVNERLLAEGLERLAAAIPRGRDLLDVFHVFIRTASDDELVRINPVRFAQRCGFRTDEVVELFSPRAEARVAHDGMAVRLPRLR
jgi:hypothetical protein